MEYQKIPSRAEVDVNYQGISKFDVVSYQTDTKVYVAETDRRDGPNTICEVLGSALFLFWPVVLGLGVSLAAFHFASLPSPIQESHAPATLYQTSKLMGDSLSPINEQMLIDRGFRSSSLSFRDSVSYSTSHRSNAEGSLSPSLISYIIQQITNYIAAEPYSNFDLFFDFNSSVCCKGNIFVDDGVKYQEIIGFGGAFTQSAAVNFFNLSESDQDAILELYFGESGIGYTIGRVPINSCDFSLESYNFDDVPNDFTLQYFDMNVTIDAEQKIPLILRAIEKLKSKSETLSEDLSSSAGAANAAYNNARKSQILKILATPWSPPPWMKVPVNGTQSMVGSAEPNGLIASEEVMSSWALYFAKFIEAYQMKGIETWAVTPQNEPLFAAPWEACAYNDSFESFFVNEYLGPTLRKHFPEVKILAYDHNKDALLNWTTTILNNNENDYVDGMAFHWYNGNDDRELDGAYGYNNVLYSHQLFPHKILLATEGCSCPYVDIGDVQSWFRAERLAHDVIFDLNNFAQGWLDWNLIVDWQGGPNHLNNMCDAPIVNFKNLTGFYIQPKYYYFGHISKFITPGSVRIDSVTVGDFGYQEFDPVVISGLQLGIFPCEKSSRQMFIVNDVTQQIELLVPSVDIGSDDQAAIAMCAGPSQGDEPYVALTACIFGATTPIVVDPSFNAANPGMIKDVNSGNCLTMILKGALGDIHYHPFKTADDDDSHANMIGMSALSGSLIALAECNPYKSNILQLWNARNLNDQSNITPPTPGQIVYQFEPQISDGSNPLMCVTAGWPMLYSTTFIDPAGQKVVVTMNESPYNTSLTLIDINRGADEGTKRVFKRFSSTADKRGKSQLSSDNLGNGKNEILYGISAKSITTMIY